MRKGSVEKWWHIKWVNEFSKFNDEVTEKLFAIHPSTSFEAFLSFTIFIILVFNFSRNCWKVNQSFASSTQHKKKFKKCFIHSKKNLLLFIDPSEVFRLSWNLFPLRFMRRNFYSHVPSICGQILMLWVESRGGILKYKNIYNSKRFFIKIIKSKEFKNLPKSFHPFWNFSLFSFYSQWWP